jgi:hypothetical protein
MTGSCRFRTQVAADRAHRGMEEKSNVADRELGDLADLLVAQAALELEVYDFTLIARKRLEDSQNPSERLARVMFFVEVARHGELIGLEGRHLHATGLLSRIEREVPAHGEQPRRDMTLDPHVILPAQPKERLLHDVPGRLEVAEEPFRIANQGPLVERQRFDHPFGFRRPAHSVLSEITLLRRLY